MKICQLASGSSITELRNMLGDGYEIVDKPDDSVDVIIGWSVSQLESIINAKRKYPNIPMVNYNWDIYEWVWNNPRNGEYNYRIYGEMLKKSAEVWVPSECTGKRTTQWFGINNWHVILSNAPYYEHKTSDQNYVLNPLREIPDKHWGLFESVCDEIGLPYMSTKHERPYDEYKDIVSNSSFIVSPLYELSTGGLTLIEGYYLGKPVLLSDSPWHGGRDYFGDRATYFKNGDREDLKEKLLYMWEHRSVPSDHKQWVVDKFSAKKMGEQIRERLAKIIKEH